MSARTSKRQRCCSSRHWTFLHPPLGEQIFAHRLRGWPANEPPSFPCPKKGVWREGASLPRVWEGMTERGRCENEQDVANRARQEEHPNTVILSWRIENTKHQRVRWNKRASWLIVMQWNFSVAITSPRPLKRVVLWIFSPFCFERAEDPQSLPR